MSKSTELAAAVDDLRYATQQLIVISDALVNLLSDDPQLVAALPEPTILTPQAPATVPEPVVAPEQGAESDSDPTQAPLTLEEVRSVLAAKSRAGFTNEVRDLITTYGANTLSGVDPDNYEALLAAVALIGAGA